MSHLLRMIRERQDLGVLAVVGIRDGEPKRAGWARSERARQAFREVGRADQIFGTDAAALTHDRP